MRSIPTEKQLQQKVKLVEVAVKGEYIARIDERRRTSRRYEIKVLVPEGFNKSDLKRATAKTLLEHKDFEDFITMRTFEQSGKATATKETRKLADFYNMRELERMKRARQKELQEDAKERGDAKLGKSGDTSDYDDKTGLPALIE